MTILPFSFSSSTTYIHQLHFSLSLSPSSLLPTHCHHHHYHCPRWPRMDSTTTTLHRNHHRLKEKIVVVLGATGTGKSRLSVDLATRFSSEIINSDKIQVYRGLDITTNKIPMHDRHGVPHHLLGEVHPDDHEFTSSQFRSLASLTISGIFSRRKLPIVAGGSNTFVHALLAHQFNPDSSDVFSGSGSVSSELRYNCCFLWVDVSLPVLYDYLSKRVDEMLELGMFDELAEFYDPDDDTGESQTRTGLRKAIGVPEFDRYFQRYPPKNYGTNFKGDPARRAAYEKAVREIKDNTFQLAKRQMGKILRLRGAGWDLRRLDATESFRAVMTSSDSGEGWRELWERQVLEPSVKIVKRFLEE